MPRHHLSVPLADDLLARVADLLLERLPGAVEGDLSDALVLLPSARACRDLGRRLLERADREALLLPTVTTDGRWLDERAAAQGLDDADLPADRLRAVLLGHRLRGEAWLEGGDAAAPGLAESFTEFFDEARRHRVDGRLLDAADPTPLLELARAADAEVLAAELERIREVWRLYRAAVPRDRLDRAVQAIDGLRAGRGLPAAPPALVVAAGFARVDPLRARLLAAALDHGADHVVVTPTATTALDRRFAATWGEEAAATAPDAAARRLAALLDLPSEQAADRTAPLGARLAALPSPEADAAPRLLVAETPEDEARAVAGEVAAWLEAHGAPRRGVTVATNDPRLAARVTARLRDAGLDADNTVGEPLAARPAGLLLRFLLRAALTGLRAEPLLEVLGHPYTRPEDDGPGAGVRALQLERLFRLETGPQAGLAALHRRAEERDAAALALFRRQGPGLEAYVAGLAAAFAPLLERADGRSHPWAVHLDALARTWDALAPDRPLAEHRDRPDLTAAAALFDELHRDAPRLPDVTLAAFTADLGRLLAGVDVVPHRPREIPVVVTGLVEARLARADLLVVAGLNDGVFPAATGTPAVLPGAVRGRLGLPTWREARARDAELTQRLLHAAPDLLLTWSRRRDGEPALPSPLVERLRLALGGRQPEEAPDVAWRRAPVPVDAIAAAQAAFAAEPPAIPRHVPARPLAEPSWTLLRAWRDCPYRSLLERGFALRADEEVRDEFRRREYGRVVHAVLHAALADEHAVHRALAAGDAEAAAAALVVEAREHFLPGSTVLPERRLWLDAFAALAPELATLEAARFARWRPVVREAAFALPLPVLHAWCGASAPLPVHAADVVFRGVIDRVDRARDEGALLVVDYKSGSVPPFRDITDGEDLQLALYAAAVATGAVPDVAPAPVAGCFYGLDPRRVGPVLPRDGEPPLRGEDMLRGAAAQLVVLAVAAADPRATHPLLPRHVAGDIGGDLPCRWCEQRGVCRVEERPLPPAVAVGLDRVVGRKEGPR